MANYSSFRKGLVHSKRTYSGLLAWNKRLHTKTWIQNSKAFNQTNPKLIQCHRGLAVAPNLTREDVSNILRNNEYSCENVAEKNRGIPGPIKSYDLNSLRSNNPIEDSHSESSIKRGTKGADSEPGVLFGVYDGHGGAACGQVVAKRLPHYVAAGLLNNEDLKHHLAALEASDTNSDYFHLVAPLGDTFELVQDLTDLYDASYTEYVRNLLRSRLAQEAENEVVSANVSERLVDSFLSLDNDMSTEAISPSMGDHVSSLSIIYAL